MSSSEPSSSAFRDEIPTVLQRGAACLACRRKKMKCDGKKPFCTQCKRARQEDDCQYDDGEHKSRHRILAEQVDLLESRLRQLEGEARIRDLASAANPDSGTPPADPALTALFSEMALGLNTSLPISSVDAQALAPSLTQVSAVQTFDTQDFSPGHLQPLAAAFLAHRYQFCPLIRFPDVFEVLSPSLKNAIYMVGARFSSSHLETSFLPSSLHALSSGLARGESVLDAIIASCILALYFFINGRLLEGHYHASAAVTLVLQCGIHQIDKPYVTETSFSTVRDTRLGPVRAPAERVLRMRIFWQVFYLDRCWSVAIGMSPGLSENFSQASAITTQFPGEEGQQVTAGSTISNFFDNPGVAASNNIEVLLVKSAALFEKASSLALLIQDASDDGHWDDYIKFQNAIEQFLATIPAITGPSASEIDLRLVVVHTLLRTAIIHLYHPFATADINIHAKSLEAARGIREVIRTIRTRQFQYLDPILGSCWMSAAAVFIRERSTIRLSAALIDPGSLLEDVEQELQSVIGATRKLAQFFPIVDLILRKIELHNASSY
ncbi:hypothetical protein SISSUDRAFT_1131882 [Sistotremastrum suecicum HHB10207 ss-3]|uniref:Zn(2)-C6 fungal-type domain-containing protein n=1 Tax=Sistotremastrum suecicum HHB10207 ss-3 TaxID=1314776 RepID=A0A165ZK20_9AGAM|nr:hypothetical protein SISSUDRAFT_1131882 [Sistotremastrum suecicum HHB10207 ss-3]